jgi:hypothetical protein
MQAQCSNSGEVRSDVNGEYERAHDAAKPKMQKLKTYQATSILEWN